MERGGLPIPSAPYNAVQQQEISPKKDAQILRHGICEIGHIALRHGRTNLRQGDNKLAPFFSGQEKFLRTVYAAQLVLCTAHILAHSEERMTAFDYFQVLMSSCAGCDCVAGGAWPDDVWMLFPRSVDLPSHLRTRSLLG